jgi:trans-aconitate methyltransferase
MTKPTTDTWDSSLYDDRHSFVWKKSSGLLELLAPQPGERILDLGCGTGHLTAGIAATGAEVLGLDSSPSMVAQARQNYPGLRFRLADATDFAVDSPYDAIFSNAVLHWVCEADKAAACMARALKPGGRLLLEMGAKGNIAIVREGIEATLREAGCKAEHRWFFPSLGEYSSVLEAHGFEIETAETFPRWNKLEHPDRGLREWIEMFGAAYFEDVPEANHKALIAEIENRLRPQLWCDGFWHADYRRLRIKARRLRQEHPPECLTT